MVILASTLEVWKSDKCSENGGAFEWFDEKGVWEGVAKLRAKVAYIHYIVMQNVCAHCGCGKSKKWKKKKEEKTRRREGTIDLCRSQSTQRYTSSILIHLFCVHAYRSCYNRIYPKRPEPNCCADPFHSLSSINFSLETLYTLCLIKPKYGSKERNTTKNSDRIRNPLFRTYNKNCREFKSI